MEFADEIEHQLHLVDNHSEEVRARAVEKLHTTGSNQQTAGDASSSCGSEGTNPGAATSTHCE